MKLKQHTLSAAFPRMSDADFLALQDDIENHGQRDPIVIFEGQVIDGWNRYQACIAVGLDPKTRTLDLAIDPVAFVKSYNLHRRHLNASQRAMAVVACSQWTPAAKTAAAAVLKESVRQQAADADVSERTIHNARAALKGGLKDAVNSGAMSVEQAAAVAKPPKKKETAAAAVFAPADDGPSDDEIRAGELAAAADAQAIEKLLESDDKLTAAYTEIKRLNAEVATLKVARDGYMNQSNQLIRTVKGLQRKLESAQA
jgi:hypothetical protein